MSTTWETPTESQRVPTPDEAAAIADVLDAGQAWADGELPLNEALSVGGGMHPHRARGLAFRFAWADVRRPALEALSLRMSGSFHVLLDDGTMLSADAWRASEAQVTWFRQRQPRWEAA